jgi:hypothetical protein
MLCLKRLVIEEGNRPVDFGDRFPPLVHFPVQSDSPSDLDRVQNALRSSFPPLILWALSEYPSLCDREKHAIKIISLVANLLSHPSHGIEFAALNCISSLLKTHAKSLSGTLLKTFLDRLDQFPAIEYITVLSAALELCTAVTFEGVILPMIIRFLTRSERYQYAVGELLLAHRFAMISPTADLFGRFLSSPVIVNEYLPQLLELSSSGGGVNEDWCCRTFPMALHQLGVTNPVMRKGVIVTIGFLAELIHPNQLYQYVVAASNGGRSREKSASWSFRRQIS